MFFPVIGARVLPTARRPQVDQNSGVSGPTGSTSLLRTRSTYASRNCMTAAGSGISRVLPPLTPDPAQPPRPVQVVDLQRGHGLTPHAREPQDQEDRHVTRAVPRLRGLHEGIQ